MATFDKLKMLFLIFFLRQTLQVLQTHSHPAPKQPATPTILCLSFWGCPLFVELEQTRTWRLSWHDSSGVFATGLRKRALSVEHFVRRSSRGPRKVLFDVCDGGRDLGRQAASKQPHRSGWEGGVPEWCFHSQHGPRRAKQTANTADGLRV